MERLKTIFRDTPFWAIVGSIVIMAAVAMIYFFPDSVEGNVLQQYDTRQGIANGQEAKAFTEATGEDTRWTNSLFGGMPTFQIAPSYPSNKLFGWLDSVLTLGMPSPAGIVFLMMLGFFILLMSMQMRWYVSLIGAIGYGFSSYFIILIGAGHIWKFVTLAYVPPTIAGLVLAYRGRYIAGAALTALFGMLQIASNHVQMTYYFLFVVFGMMVAYLITAISKKQMRRWLTATGALAVAGVLAVGANLPSLYNTYEYSKETIRCGHSELTHGKAPSEAQNNGLDKNYITQYSYGGSETFTLLIPNVKGGATVLPQKGEHKFLSLAELDEVKELAANGNISPETEYYLQQFPQYFGEPEATNGPVYVGALICALFLLGCVIVRGPMKWVLLALTVLSVLLALGRNCMWLTDWMIDYFPMYNKFRTPESILVIAEFTMPLLAAMALQKLLSEKQSEVWKKYGLPILITFGFTILVCLLAVVAPSIFGNPLTDMEAQVLQGYTDLATAIEVLRLGMVSGDALRSFLIVFFGFLALYSYARNRISVGVTALAIGVIVCCDLYTVNKRYLNHDSFMPPALEVAENFPPTVADKAILADTAMNYRVMDYARFTSPDPSFHHKSIGGYHAAKLSRYQDILDYFMSGKHDNANMLNMLNAKYFILKTNEMPMLNPDAMGNAWLVDKVSYVDTPDAEIAAVETINIADEAVADKRFADILGSSAMKSVGDTIFETSYAPNRLTYHVTTAKGGVAVFSEVYFPWGWHAAIDGVPAEIGRVNYILRAINVPAGSHTIEMWFAPESLRTTSTVAYIAIILIYILLIGSLVYVVVRKPREEDVKKDTDND